MKQQKLYNINQIRARVLRSELNLWRKNNVASQDNATFTSVYLSFKDDFQLLFY